MSDSTAEKAWEEYSAVAVAGNRRDFMAGRTSRDAEVAELRAEKARQMQADAGIVRKLREQLAEARSEIERRPEPAFRDALIADRNKAEYALAEAQATIEAIGLERKVIRGAEQDILNGRPEMDALEEIEISNRHIDEILSAPSSTGGND